MYAQSEDDPEECGVLGKLRVMFPSVPNWRLREVCKENHWDLAASINKLINISTNAGHAFTDVQISQQQVNVNGTDNVSNFTEDEKRIGSVIKKGYRVMIIMRGPPGVGKSYLAKSLVTNFVDLGNSYTIEDFVCSSDDYFYDAKGAYNYNSLFISEAHDFNHRRVRDKTKSGLSPIIVDNTNMQLWEMLPYVKFAVQNHYMIEILEPKTHWRNSANALAEKNKHGVPKNSIRRMMEKYEKGNVGILIKMLKNTTYSKILPQMRLLPPLHTLTINSEKIENIDNIPEGELIKEDILISQSKEQRTKFKSKIPLTEAYNDNHQGDCPAVPTRDVYNLLEQKSTNIWKPYRFEFADSWGVKEDKLQEAIYDSKKINAVDKCLLDLLKEDSSNSTLQPDVSEETKGITFFQRHRINCPNENSAFASLRQIYPNKSLPGLWDLFVKCNGNIEWAIDILLKEDELKIIQCDEDLEESDDVELFKCLCTNFNEETARPNHKNNIDSYFNTSLEDNIKSILNTPEVKPQRDRFRYYRSRETTNPALLKVKENIENCFVLRDDMYSKNLQKVRNIRNGVNDETVLSNTGTENSENIKHEEFCGLIESTDTDNIEEDIESDNSSQDMLEMALGEQLINQLVDTFKNESSVEGLVSSSLPINIKVSIPRPLAKQLYMLWVESALNNIEDDRQKILKDEDFARLLQNPKYSEFKQSPSNLREILDMEYAWKIYNQDKEDEQQQFIDIEKSYTSSDLASHLTRMKLCETFPDIPRETLIDILLANGNDYNATVSVLRSTMQEENASITHGRLVNCARREQYLVNQHGQNEIGQRKNRIWEDNDTKSNLSPEEAKRLALRDFEESRNLAAHHCQLKAECYHKAKQAIQSGNGGAAIYYSQIANLHINKIDMYNHRAANCIIEVHKNTQNNPDLLDLHYLYLIEALGCLDLFLDRHITGLRLASRNYKHVFIITGRGKHSTGGVSTIKNKVKARLKERCLRWSEVNPGLLKVKIFPGSRHSKNI